MPPKLCQYWLDYSATDERLTRVEAITGETPDIPSAYILDTHLSMKMDLASTRTCRSCLSLSIKIRTTEVSLLYGILFGTKMHVIYVEFASVDSVLVCTLFSR